MISNTSAAPRSVHRLFGTFLIAAASLLAGCATHFVDGNLKEPAATAFARPAQPKPVQLVTEFQTKGVANARATDLVKPMVNDAVRSTGLFAEVRDTPAPSAGLLSVTVNNVALTDDAAKKGFIAGLTFGAAGQTVTDGYICTVSYLAPGASTPVVKSVRHAIHTNVGSAAPPPNTYKAADMTDAVRTMLRQAIGAAMNDLSHDPAFQ